MATPKLAGSLGPTPNSSVRSTRAPAQRRDHSERNADAREPHPLPDDELEQRRRPRTEREPHAELARALRDDVRQHAVNAERAEQQRHDREERRELRREARLADAHASRRLA